LKRREKNFVALATGFLGVPHNIERWCEMKICGLWRQMKTMDLNYEVLVKLSYDSYAFCCLTSRPMALVCLMET
jgi:hypothetical protein